MIGFIDNPRVAHGVASICRVLPIAPSTYYAYLTVRADPIKASARQQRYAALRPKIKKVWNDNWQVYGVGKHGGSCVAKARLLRAALWHASWRS